MGKVGLVLEGGGMRGLFTTGVIDALLASGVRLDGLVGVSAGACFGCNYQSGQVGRALRYNLTYCRDRRYCSAWSLLRTGDLFGADFCYRELPLELDPFDCEAFDASGVPFWVVCTSVTTGKPVYHLCQKADEDMLQWIRASASMPVVSRPVEREGELLLDGGIADPIPLEFSVAQGYDRNVVVLTQPRDYVKRQSKASGALRWALRKQPAIAQAMQDRPRAYNEAHARALKAEQEGAAFVLCPDEPLPTGRVEHDARRLMQAYFAGEQVAARAMPQLKDWLAER